MRRLVLLAPLLLGACQTGETAKPVASAPPAVIARSTGQAVKDDTIKAQVGRRILELDRRAYRAVTVESWGGRVLLMGAVIKPEQRRKAEQTARAQDGVTDVLNELVLAEDRALDAFAADPTREAALRKALNLDGTGTVARVINGVAFLLGAASTPEAAAAMKADAIEVDGVKWVVSHLKAQ